MRLRLQQNDATSCGSVSETPLENENLPSKDKGTNFKNEVNNLNILNKLGSPLLDNF
jgi:hypothetical protein